MDERPKYNPCYATFASRLAQNSPTAQNKLEADNIPIMATTLTSCKTLLLTLLFETIYA